MTARIVSIIIMLSFVTCGICMAADEIADIGYLFKDKPEIKVYVGSVENVSGKDELSVDVFKKTLEDSLVNRKAMKFVIVKDPAESDIQITAIIKKYQYLDRGPFNPSPGIATTLIDAAATATQNYAEMTAEFTVTSTPDNNKLWSHDVDEYVKRIMAEEESYPLIFDEISRKFIWKCFGSAHERGIVPQPR